MSYKELYEWAQLQTAPVSRKLLKPEICRISGHSNVKVFGDPKLEAIDSRGYFVDPGDQHRYAQQSGGCPVIVVSQDLNKCWQRLVWTKEAMHLLDTALERTSNPTEFVNLIGELGSQQPARSLQMRSEVYGYWMAIGVLCPENKRQELGQARIQEDLPDLEIARMLKIPEKCIPDLLHPNFKEIISEII